MTTLPPASAIIAAVRELGEDDRDTWLDQYAPAIDEYASTAEVAGWLGIKPQTIRHEQYRPRKSGKKWPKPDRRFGTASAWKYRTIVLYRATQPRPGEHAPRERTV